MYDCEKGGVPQPLIKSSDTYLAKAEKYYHLKEYEIAGNLLRKEAEAFCEEFLPKKYHFTPEFNRQDLNGLIVQCIKFAESAGLDKKLFEKLDSHRHVVLNTSSHHSYDVPKFNSEIGDCLDTLQRLRQIRNEPFLERTTQLEFDLTSADGSDVFKFEIKLEDDFRLIKEPGNDSVICHGMVNYWVIRNGIKGNLQHGNESLKKMYEINYAKSDKSKSADFWEEIKISGTGDPLKIARRF